MSHGLVAGHDEVFRSIDHSLAPVELGAMPYSFVVTRESQVHAGDHGQHFEGKLREHGGEWARRLLSSASSTLVEQAHTRKSAARARVRPRTVRRDRHR
jgi:hypothetical protein